MYSTTYPQKTVRPRASRVTRAGSAYYPDSALLVISRAERESGDPSVRQSLHCTPGVV